MYAAFLLEDAASLRGEISEVYGRKHAETENRILKTYFMHSKGIPTVKIGKSVEPESRLGTLRTASPLPPDKDGSHRLKLLLVIDTPEAELHSYLKPYCLNRHRGDEWFHFAPVIKAMIEYARTHGNLPARDQWSSHFPLTSTSVAA